MSLFDGFLDALYPKGVRCAMCSNELKRSERMICKGCAGSLTLPDEHGISGLCGFTAGLSYTESLHPLVHRFKYSGEACLAAFLSEGITIPPEWKIDALVPVPLHPARKRLRGYNQSELIADELEARCNIPVRDIMSRTKNTRTQTRLGREKRMKNLSGAFLSEDCTGLRLVLIDDVCTTGATLSECAKALYGAGAEAVYAAVACLA